MPQSKLICLSLAAFTALSIGFPALGYDDDTTINKISMDKENFLDIKAYQPRKSQDYQWYDATTGARIYAGSLDHDDLYQLTEYKLQSDLSEYFIARITSAQEDFYAIKPFPLPILEAQVFPMGENLGVSLLGTIAYDKRQSDMGGAISWGRQPWNYTRLTWMKVDAMYNRKNHFDESYYSDTPTTTQLEGAYVLQNKHIIRYTFSLDSTLELITPENQGTFRHKGNSYHAMYDYRFKQTEIVGITVRGFAMEKSSRQTDLNQDQDTRFTTVDLYWADLDRDRERRMGLQVDSLHNQFNDYVDPANSLEYGLDTIQLYGTHRFPFTTHTAWDLGVHLAWAMEEKLWTPPEYSDEQNDSFQGKFRTGFEYFALDRKSFFQINISVELDNLIDSPINGGAASFQKVF